MPDEKITLDREVFKTLASETRVGILKSLDSRRKTLSELSKQFGMSVSTIKEHLDNLVAVGLIEQMDEGHKWKYYELTGKGKNILHPEDKKVWILLGVSALGIIVLGFDLLRNFMNGAASFAASAPMLSGNAFGEAAREAGQKAADAANATPSFVLPQLPYLHIAGLMIFALLMAASVLYIRKSKRRMATMAEVVSKNFYFDGPGAGEAARFLGLTQPESDSLVFTRTRKIERRFLRGFGEGPLGGNRTIPDNSIDWDSMDGVLALYGLWWDRATGSPGTAELRYDFEAPLNDGSDISAGSYLVSEAVGWKVLIDRFVASNSGAGQRVLAKRFAVHPIWQENNGWQRLLSRAPWRKQCLEFRVERNAQGSVTSASISVGARL